MAPAILSNGKSEAKKSKLSAKQNRKKMDPERAEVPIVEERVPIDFEALKSKLLAEDRFISNLLTYIPTQGPVASTENGSVTSDDVASTENGISANRASNHEELKERLAAKLSQFQGKRLDFSENKLKTKLKRKLDRMEKKKLKKKNTKMKAKFAKLAQATKAAATSPPGSIASSSSVKSEIHEPVVQSRPPKPIFNSEGRVVYSKFDFGELTAPTIEKKKNLDTKAALHKIKKMEEKVKHLQEIGEVEKAKTIEEKRAWQSALQRAEGVKVKDNADLLNKSLKKQKKEKLKKKKDWEGRVQAQEKQKEDRQKKRKENINKKKTEKKEHKMKLNAKKGRFAITV